MEHRGQTDQTVADLLDLPRTTVYRWRMQQHRLSPDKMALLAGVLGIEPEQLWRAPGRPSIDAMLKSATPEQIADMIAFAERFILKK